MQNVLIATVYVLRINKSRKVKTFMTFKRSMQNNEQQLKVCKYF